MTWIIKLYLFGATLIKKFIDDLPIQNDCHSWTDKELDRLTPETREAVLAQSKGASTVRDGS